MNVVSFYRFLELPDPPGPGSTAFCDIRIRRLKRIDKRIIDTSKKKIGSHHEYH